MGVRVPLDALASLRLEAPLLGPERHPPHVLREAQPNLVPDLRPDPGDQGVEFGTSGLGQLVIVIGFHISKRTCRPSAWPPLLDRDQNACAGHTSWVRIERWNLSGVPGSAKVLLRGGYSSAARALGRGPRRRGFESRYSPQGRLAQPGRALPSHGRTAGVRVPH